MRPGGPSRIGCYILTRPAAAMVPPRRRISFVRKRGDNLLASGVLRFRVLGPTASRGREIAVPARPPGGGFIATVAVGRALVPRLLRPVVPEGAVPLIRVR